MFARCVLAFAVLAAVASAGWVDLFAPPFQGAPTILTAISCLSADSCICASGTDITNFNGKTNGAFTPYKQQGFDLMVIAVAAGGSDSAPTAVAGGFGYLNYLSNGAFVESLPKNFFIEVQDIAVNTDGTEYLVLDQVSLSVLYSNNSGMNFTQFPITTMVPPGAYCRYGAIVDSQTWYVAIGDFPSSSSSAASGSSFGSAAMARRQQKKDSAKKAAAPAPASSGSSGNGTYSAVITKTTDGGQTWENLFYNESTWYFNDIACGNATWCVAVGEGFNANAGAHIVMTTDGITFNEVLFLASNSTTFFSLVSVAYNVDGTVWVAGSIEMQNSAVSLIMFSADGGNTWMQDGSDLANIGDVMSLSFVNGVGFASAITVYEDSTVLKYTA